MIRSGAALPPSTLIQNSLGHDDANTPCLHLVRPAAAEAAKPEDWDEEEDGDWEPPKIANPKCKDAPGCGEWKRPNKPVSGGDWAL